MANEATMVASLKLDKNGSIKELGISALSVTVTGDDYQLARQKIGTSEETLTLGDVTLGGLVLIINRDSANFVELRSGTGVADLIRINAGEPFLGRFSSDATVYAIADTAEVVIEYFTFDT